MMHIKIPMLRLVGSVYRQRLPARRPLTTIATTPSSPITDFRTCTLNQLTTTHENSTVTVAGWVRAIRPQKHSTFIDISDAFGAIQVVIPTTTSSTATTMREQDVIKATGTLKQRKNARNQPTSWKYYEIQCESIEILNAASHPLPLEMPHLDISNDNAATPNTTSPQQREAQMRFRYLELRKPYLQRNLRLRAAVNLAMRQYLSNIAGFLEVETPTLFKSTPEGAREFLVPTRTRTHQLEPRFYALAQSPQQFKQLLMVGAIDRYYQFARCYRDEDGRADRQPEFTQLDLEMSFVDHPIQIQHVVEGVVRAAWDQIRILEPENKRVPSSSIAAKPFPRITYAEAMAKFGSDKPDMTFGLEIFRNPGSPLHAFTLPAPHHDIANEVLATMNDDVHHQHRGEISSENLQILGQARLKAAKLLGEKHGANAVPRGRLVPGQPFWVIDFPMFEWNEQQHVTAVHHPFTSPQPDSLTRLQTWLTSSSPPPPKTDLVNNLLGNSFDLVCDGIELGGGSLRIHNATLQRQVFCDVLGMDKIKCEETFKHLFKALEVGAPPHGGFAIGFDRFIASLCGATSVSSVIAFPKTSGEATDPMTGAPSPVDDVVIRGLGMKNIA